MLVSRKRSEPSDAETKFLKDLDEYNNRCTTFQNVIDKVKNKSKYQQVQVRKVDHSVKPFKGIFLDTKLEIAGKQESSCHR